MKLFKKGSSPVAAAIAVAAFRNLIMWKEEAAATFSQRNWIRKEKNDVASQLMAFNKVIGSN